jgi:hypothetical protein
MPCRCWPLPFRQRRPLLHPVRDGVVRIAPAPRRLCLRTPLALTLLFRARVLPRAHPLIRPEPSSTKPAWPFLEPRVHRAHACRDSSFPPSSRLRPRPPRPLAYFWRADPDYVSRAAKTSVENRSHWEDGFAIPARSRVPLASARSDRKNRTGLGPHPQATKSWRKPVILRTSFPLMSGGLGAP